VHYWRIWSILSRLQWRVTPPIYVSRAHGKKKKHQTTLYLHLFLMRPLPWLTRISGLLSCVRYWRTWSILSRLLWRATTPIYASKAHGRKTTQYLHLFLMRPLPWLTRILGLLSCVHHWRTWSILSRLFWRVTTPIYASRAYGKKTTNQITLYCIYSLCFLYHGWLELRTCFACTIEELDPCSAGCSEEWHRQFTCRGKSTQYSALYWCEIDAPAYALAA